MPLKTKKFDISRYCDIRELQDPILSKSLWRGFEKKFRVVAQFQSPRGFLALYVTTTEFAPTQAFLELSADSAPHT